MVVHIWVVVSFSVLLLCVAFLVGARNPASQSKDTPFECGFDPKDSARLPFSMRFFLLAVLFLVFDIEVALLFPVIVGLSLGLVSLSLFALFAFGVVLLVGLLHEWNQGSLSWVL